MSTQTNAQHEAAIKAMAPALRQIAEAKDEPANGTTPPEKIERAGKHVGLALEHAVERGKLRPYEALEAAAHFGVLLQPWVQRQHDHYTRNNGSKS